MRPFAIEWIENSEICNAFHFLIRFLILKKKIIHWLIHKQIWNFIRLEEAEKNDASKWITKLMH